jgi:uncharacterized protein YegP (UPF0339 family)
VAAKYELFESGSKWYFNLRGGNGERILQSEAYTTRAAAQNGIAACRANSPIDGRYQRLVSKDQKPYFVLRAGNNEVIGASETYSSQSARDVGIASCKLNGPGAPVEG